LPFKVDCILFHGGRNAFIFVCCLGLAYKHPIPIYFDDEVISLLDLGVERPRDAMMIRASETEALYEGYAQKGFGVSSLDGSPVPLGSTATHEPIEITRSLWGRWKPPMPQG
jgi:hypothetical protein